ncbi:MAG: hypothetical protein PQJ60_14505 [Spirochaetales bacterium]|nr:hypothetical protein [Spirochaetales bacterium]
MATKTLPPWVIGTFFYIGLVSATLFRLIIFLNRVNLFYARLAWYVGVVGYILFFGFRFYIAKKRRRTIEENDLISKLKASDMDSDSKREIEYILKSLIKSKEIFNYRYIFVTSAAAILLDLVLTFL